MPEQKKKGKRKGLSQKTRFEVFKRDQFTCQYCGRKAPDVVLQVDHIVPVAEGGKNDILNLVTSCVDCNSGKRDRKLDDASVVERQRREMELRQERLEQIRMMGEWQCSLVDVRSAELNEVQNLFKRLTNGRHYIAQDFLEKTISGHISRFGLVAVLEAMRDGFAFYADADKTLSKLGGICANNADPETHLKTKILCAMRRRFASFYWNEAAAILSRGKAHGGMDFLNVAMGLVYEYNDGCYWPHVKQGFISLADKYEVF